MGLDERARRGRVEDVDRAERLLEKAKDAKEAEEFDGSPLAKLLDRLNGKGSLRVWRIKEDGKPYYSGTMPGDGCTVDNFEERLAKFVGGGDFEIKFFYGEKNHGSLSISVDVDVFPPRKTINEVRKEGGPVPQTMNELIPVLVKAMAELMPRQAPGNDAALMKYLLDSQERSMDRMALMFAGGKPGGANAPTSDSPWKAAREAVGFAKELQEISGGGGGGGGDDKFERRSLAWKLLDGPVTKALERGADRVIDKWMPEGEQQQQQRPQLPKTTEASGPAATALPRNTRQIDLTQWKKQGEAGELRPAPRAKAAAPQATNANAKDGK